MDVFYASIRITEIDEFDKIRTAGVTGNATDYKNSQGDNSIINFAALPGIFTTSRHWLDRANNKPPYQKKSGFGRVSS